MRCLVAKARDDHEIQLPLGSIAKRTKSLLLSEITDPTRLRS